VVVVSHKVLAAQVVAVVHLSPQAEMASQRTMALALRAARAEILATELAEGLGPHRPQRLEMGRWVVVVVVAFLPPTSLVGLVLTTMTLWTALLGLA